MRDTLVFLNRPTRPMGDIHSVSYTLGFIFLISSPFIFALGMECFRQLTLDRLGIQILERPARYLQL